MEPMTTTVSLGKLEEARQGPYFKSKKNRVFRSVLHGEVWVVKVYNRDWSDRASLEFEVLRDCRARGVAVPRPISLLEGAIVMEHVPGEHVSDLFDDLMSDLSSPNLSDELSGLAESMAAWLSSFHTAFGFELTRGDAILRNFIVGPGGPVGLDFEESARADALTDLGQTCASALMTDPAFTEHKVLFAQQMSDAYWKRTGEDRSEGLPDAIEAAVRHYAQFRPNGIDLVDKWSMTRGRFSSRQ